jgi:AcrR family transcriptional regulator
VFLQVAAMRGANIGSGVDVPVRDIAARAGVGVGTIYRHFPTRADLIVAVHRHQDEACADAGLTLLHDGNSPHAALIDWINLFVDFLITKRMPAYEIGSAAVVCRRPRRHGACEAFSCQ